MERRSEPPEPPLPLGARPPAAPPPTASIYKQLAVFKAVLRVPGPNLYILGLMDPVPDPLVRGIDPDPDPSIIMQK
jgi:hypothetical protein